MPSPAAFHAQQAMGKGLKAFLVAKDRTFEKVHNLPYLLDLCGEEDEAFEAFREDAERLTPFAVEPRYPGPRDEPSPEEARTLVGRVM